MTEPVRPKMQFDVVSVRLSAHASVSRCKDAKITLDTDLAGNPEAFNPAELLLAALSACMIKGIERVTPILEFSTSRRGSARARRAPGRAAAHGVDPYEIMVDTDEPDRRLGLLHENVKKYGTVFNTVAPGTALTGVLRSQRSHPR